ncbi:MAG TPA: acyclic terpene utilization AtuA family protein [Gemmataceae bacterium]|nr:acyclic terpene utilization AtuA family protein [Gemmataceae bacterium]
MKTIRIGNGCGFWGDNLDAPVLLAQYGQLDYLTLEYLAELTMSILAQQKQRDPQAGFATDFLDVLERLVPTLKVQPQLKIITNAGGMNPTGCAASARAILAKGGIMDRPIAAISGDDLLPRLDSLLADNYLFTNHDTQEPLTAVRDRVVSANAYLGARPIVDALQQGASIVITGRVADASLTLAPAAHEFGWRWEDWDRLCAGTVAGHIIECGAQATGGLWCNWEEIPNFANIGYPIAEIGPDGTFCITKPKTSGGRVNIETITEQLLYEIGDPAAYLTPDVTADFTSFTLKETGPDVVSVQGCRGRPATDTYKVSIAYRDGFMASGTLTIFGPQAPAKAKKAGNMILQRLERIGIKPEHSAIECLGTGACVPGVVSAREDPPEVVLRVGARDSRKAVVERFTKEFAPLVTSGPVGVTGYTTGRPPVREVFAFWPALVAKSAVSPCLEIYDRKA